MSSSFKDILESHLSAVKNFLNNTLLLELHPHKTKFRNLSWGIDFLGYVALPYYEVLRTKTKKRIFKQVKKKTEEFEQGTIDRNTFQQSLASYLGILKHADAHKIKKMLVNSLPSEFRIYTRLARVSALHKRVCTQNID